MKKVRLFKDEAYLFCIDLAGDVGFPKVGTEVEVPEEVYAKWLKTWDAMGDMQVEMEEYMK